jgi:hypothetical protein
MIKKIWEDRHDDSDHAHCTAFIHGAKWGLDNFDLMVVHNESLKIKNKVLSEALEFLLENRDYMGFDPYYRDIIESVYTKAEEALTSKEELK